MKEKLEAEAREWLEGRGVKYGTELFGAEIAELLAAFALEREQRWIPIRSEEDLPTESGWYLVTCAGTQLTTWVALIAATDEGEKVWCLENGADVAVTAWQPLLEPYTEGE